MTFELSGNCKHTLLSPHRKRRCYSFVFLLGNFVLSILCAVYCKNTFIILCSSFFGFLLSEKSKRNVNLVNRLSNSSLYVVALFPPKTSTPCARIRITIEIGAKNEVLDPVYPLPCLPSWRKPLSYLKSKVLRRRPLTLETSAIHQISQAKNIPYQLLLIKPIFSLLANAEKTCSFFFQNG